MKLKNKNYDIILIGDSSALTGIKPIQLSNIETKKLYNLSLYANSGIFSFNKIYSEYLKNNKKPKAVILYISYNSVEAWHKVTYEKSIVVFRYGSFYEIVNYIYNEPYSIPVMINRSIRAVTKHIIYGKNKHISFKGQVYDKLNSELGYYNSNPNNKLECSKKIALDKKNIEKLKDIKNVMKQRYDNFYLYISPLPKCLIVPREMRLFFNELADNKIYKIENFLFKDLNHMKVKGAEVNTKILENWYLNKVK